MTVSLTRMAKLGRNLTNFRRNAGWQLGLGASLFKKARGSRIVLYHGVCQRDPFRFSTLFVTNKTLEEHIKLYKQYFNVISLEDYYLGRTDPDRMNICLSFDDGFANNYQYVLPLLEKYRVPASFFITGIRDAGDDILWNDFIRMAAKEGYLSDPDRKELVSTLRLKGFEVKAAAMRALELAGFNKQSIETEHWLQMTEEEIKNLSASPWATIGSHGYYHNDLAKIPAHHAADEMERSKKFLERVTGKNINAFAFPYGTFTTEVLALAKEKGFTRILGTDLPQGINEDKVLKARLTINPFISPVNQMYANIAGHYG
ncbi:MAG TPA: polysaccharide deacetylase family protein [Chitinophagaceae bacterium]|nr:polysaccharide deacetylase family protein [Chitinophagaceae bacterium]